MLEPGFYPHAPAAVELRDTHISWVLLAGDLAYKVKKPVVFPFLDYGSVDRRREMCAEEVRLNRRLAPDIYLRVVGLARRGDRCALTGEDDPEAIEYAVEMRRVEEDRSLAALAAGGRLEAAHVDAVARRLARFHSEAEPAPPEARDVGVLAATLSENLATIAGAGGGAIVGPRALAAAERFTAAFLAARRGELEARAGAGLIRDGHGDLRAEHVIVPAAGDPYVYDCVEFNPDLRRIDVGVDLAFLVMDLARLGAAAEAIRLVDAYREAGGDPGDDALIAFFASYRAWVRAKIACLRAGELDRSDPGAERQRDEAGELFRLGRRFAWRARPPLVLAICGVAGSGKTTLARELAALSGWPRLASDLVRKRLAGLEPTERAAPEHYSREFTERTYRELGAAARAALGEGGGAIVDATFHRRAERDAFRAGLDGGAAPLLFVECRGPVELLRARVRDRELDPDRVSDAGVEIVERQLAALEPPAEIPERDRTQVDADAPPSELAAEVEQAIDNR